MSDPRDQLIAAALLAVLREEPTLRIIKRPTYVCTTKKEVLANMKRALHLPPSHSFVRDGYPGAPRRRRNLTRHPLYSGRTLPTYN